MGTDTVTVGADYIAFFCLGQYLTIWQIASYCCREFEFLLKLRQMIEIHYAGREDASAVLAWFVLQCIDERTFLFSQGALSYDLACICTRNATVTVTMFGPLI